METQLGDIFHTMAGSLPRLGAAILVLGAFWLAGLVTARLALRLGSKDTENLRRAVVRVVRATLIVIGGISALGTLGVNVTAMVAGLGLTGFAVGFALKDVLSNLVAGVFILFYRPFTFGDQITVSGVEGRVDSIDLRYTTLVNDDGRLLIPNSVILTEKVLVRTSSA